MTTTATATRRTRKPARVAHGTYNLISTGNLPLTAALDSGDAMLTIHPETGKSANYTVKRLTDGDEKTVGFRVTKLTPYIVDRKAYEIDISPESGWQCDCPDAQFQNRECKHVRSLRAVLAKKGITIAAPQRQHLKPMPLEDL
jgi:hypothetical protein